MIGRPLPQFWSQLAPGERAFPCTQPCSLRLTCSPPTTSTPRTARACAGSSISKLGEASQTTLHGIHAQAPPAAAVQRALSPPRALRIARSRSASALRPTPRAVGNGRRITEELCSCGGRVGNGGASSGGDSSAAATRRAVVCGGARRRGDRQAGCWLA